MKNLITSVACVILLMAFVVQFAQNQSLYHQMVNVNHFVRIFEDQIQTRGFVDEESEEWLCEQISMVMACEPDAVVIDGTKERKKKGELLHYEVRFPVSKLLAAPEFWGIADEENQDIYVISRDTSSKAEESGGTT